MLKKIDVNGEALQLMTSDELVKGRPTLLALHGADDDHLAWILQREALGEKINFIAPDLPGHGESAGKPRSSIAEYRDVAVGLIGALGLGPVFLMGHSMGGAVALQTALSNPELLKGIILVGSGARLKVSPAILQGLEANYEQAIKMSSALMFSPEAPKELVDEFLQRKLDRPTPETAIKDFTVCNEFDIMEEVGNIRTPTLVVSSTTDRMTPSKYGEYLARKIAGARFVLIEGSGHHIALERGKELSGCLEEFIREVAG